MTNAEKITQIDAILPQTQCDLCGYGGCKPYATAMVVSHAPIDKCPPGGVDTLAQLADIMHIDYRPLLTNFLNTVKQPAIAVIKEPDCIGCTKCIQACPVDAIIGAPKSMHTVIAQECTGCELCIAPCPVDCIDIHVIAKPAYQPSKARERFTARTKRLADAAQRKAQRRKMAINGTEQTRDPMQVKRDYIQRALARKRQQETTRISEQHEKTNHQQDF